MSAERPPAVPTTWIGAGLGFNQFVAEAASALCFQNTRHPTRLSQSIHRVSSIFTCSVAKRLDSGKNERIPLQVLARRCKARACESQCESRWGRVSRVETDSESGGRGSGMILVYLQAFTARRRERNSWHEVCNVQKETDSEVSRSRRLHGARRLATRGNGAPAALAKPQPQPSND